QVMQQALQAIGLTVQLVPTAGTTIRPTWQTGNYDAAVKSITGRVDPASTLNVSYLGQDNVGTPPAELTHMTTKALVLPVGSKDRNKAYQAISKYLVDNPIQVPILQGVFTYAYSSNTVGAKNLVCACGTYPFRGMGVSKR